MSKSARFLLNVVNVVLNFYLSHKFLVRKKREEVTNDLMKFSVEARGKYFETVRESVSEA